MFLAGRKELGEETGIGWLDAEKSKTEFWANLLSYYGLWNPFTYQKLTVSPLPDDPAQGTGLMLPDSSGGAMIPAPDTPPVLGQTGEDTKLIPPQVGGEGGLKTPDYIKLSEELGTKIEYEGYKIIDIEDAAQANADWADMGYNLPPIAKDTIVYNVEAGNFEYARVFKEGLIILKAHSS